MTAKLDHIEATSPIAAANELLLANSSETMKETEADTRANRIDPVLRDAGWGVDDGTTAERKGVRYIFDLNRAKVSR